MKAILFFITFLISGMCSFGQTNSFVTEYYLANTFTPKAGITPGSNNTLLMDCDQILARYQVSISGVTTTGNRLPSQNQLTATGGCPSVGDSYGGGIVVYLFVSGDVRYVAGECHGIISSTVDQSASIIYSCVGENCITTTIKGFAEETTTCISESCPSTGASTLCYNLTYNGHSNWLCPTRDELLLMYAAKNSGYLSGFGSTEYWTSSRFDVTNGHYVNMSTGATSYTLKSTTKAVRAIRYF